MEGGGHLVPYKASSSHGCSQFCKVLAQCAPLPGAFGVGLEGLVWLLVDVASF